MGTYKPIASITLGSSASSVEFSSIPQNFRDLVLVVDDFTTSSDQRFIQVNGDTSNTYANITMGGTGSGTDSSSDGGTFTFNLTESPSFSGSTNSQYIVNFMDYSVTDKDTTILWRMNSSQSVIAGAGRYNTTTAITSIRIFNVTFTTGSTFALYGIEA